MLNIYRIIVIIATWITLFTLIIMWDELHWWDVRLIPISIPLIITHFIEGIPQKKIIYDKTIYDRIILGVIHLFTLAISIGIGWIIAKYLFYPLLTNN